MVRHVPIMLMVPYNAIGTSSVAATRRWTQQREDSNVELSKRNSILRETSGNSLTEKQKHHTSDTAKHTDIIMVHKRTDHLS